MSRATADAIDLAGGNDAQASVNWAAVEAGPVIVHPLRVKRPDLPGSMFADGTWSLRPMDVTRGTVQNLHWIPGHKDQQYSVPPHLVAPFKRVVWLMINRPTPESYLAGRSGLRWPSASSLIRRFIALRRFAQFLGQHEITQIGDVNDDLLDMYATSVLADESLSSQVKATYLGDIALIAHLADYLPEADRMIEPSWSAEDLAGGGRARAADNSKEIIHPDTFAPLLWWSQQILRCAPDIVAAVKWLNMALRHPRAKECSSAGLDAVAQIVASRGGVLPQAEIGGRVAAQYLIALHGGEIHIRDFGRWRKQRGGIFSVDPDLAQPIPVPVTCVIEGHAWLPLIDYRDIEKLQRVLQAAAAVVICTCTGMRGEECTKLQRGALRTVLRPDGARSYRIDGRIFKAVRDNNDQQDRGGKQWVWATIKPGADAITALEHLAEVTGSSGLMAHLDSPNQPGLTSETMTRWINELIEYANGLRTALEVHQVHHIAPDPAGNVTLDRFRRTVAWHIVNQPEGLLAAGVQFGHMQSTTTDGYASTITSGIAATMDEERTRALYATLQEHANAAKTGMKASGPAAKQFGKVLNGFVAKRFPGTYADLSKKDERRLRSDPDLAVRKNPGHGCLCLANPLKPGTMACSRENDGEPNRNDCKTYCGNRVYTDATVAEDQEEAAQLRARVRDANPILAARINKRVRHLDEHIAEHESTALPLLEIMTAEEAKAKSASAEESKIHVRDENR